MFGSDILEIAIGMVFIYLLTSLVVTAANEMVAALLKSRGKTLWQGITQLLPTGSGNEKGKRDANSAAATHDDVNLRDFANALYNHPLIAGLHPSGKPSYLPSRTFTLALLDVISKHAKEGNLTEENIHKAINLLPDDLKKPLNLLWQEGGGNIEHFKTNVEVWFNNAMDRVSGIYKRKSQVVVFLIAFAVAASLNVDSIVLMKRLASDKAMRTALVAQAEKYHPVNAPAPSANNGASTSADLAERQQNFESALNQIKTFDLPIGWRDPADPKKVIPVKDRPGQIPVHLLGWLLTTIAASLGAPFWFDVLNKFMNIRSAGRAPEEKPKDPKAAPPAAEVGKTTATGTQVGEVM